ncbi:hypothetical protein ACQY1Q_02610 [Tenacibaculum sp. TC6]|uniref:hypothetical protein n=1 Tax=Tenacibaculum sp. TC6 TaxID=3423223 RepID=UPI003D362E6E
MLSSIIKKAFVILILLNIQNLFACSCGIVPLMDRIPMSDFIATAKILKVSPDKENSNLHNIEIEIIELYKGKATSNLKIYSVLNSSCAFYTPENSKWLIFANKNKNGDLSFGFCSGAKQLDRKFYSDRYPNAEKNHKKSIELKLQVLDYLKRSEIQPSNEFGLRASFSDGCLKNFKGIEVKNNRFALYELTIENDLSISEVKAIKEFDTESLKLDLLNCVKESVEVYARKKEIEIPNKTRIIIGLYYYPAERSNLSFIGQFDL